MFKYNEEHYFSLNLDYKNRGEAIINSLLDGCSTKERKLLLNGLQINTKKFNENTFLQHAVECTINNYFKKNFKNFRYEPRATNGNKNMDCGIDIDDLKINFEIKCPSIGEKDESAYYVKSIGFDTPLEAKEKSEPIIDNLRVLVEKSEDLKYKKVLEPSEIGGAQNKSSTLLNFLKETNLKKVENEINILVVSLYSKESFTEWINYYWDIIINKNNKEIINGVDGIIFTNTINYHVNNSISTINPWDLKKHFTFFIRNPLKSKNNFNIVEEQMIKIFEKSCIDLEKRMMEFDKNLEFKMNLEKAKIIMKVYSMNPGTVIIYSNEYVVNNIEEFKDKLFFIYDSLVEKHKELLKKSEIREFKKNVNIMIEKAHKNLDYIGLRVERLGLGKALIEEIEEKEGIKFYNNDKYFYKKEN